MVEHTNQLLRQPQLLRAIHLHHFRNFRQRLRHRGSGAMDEVATPGTEAMCQREHLDQAAQADLVVGILLHHYQADWKALRSSAAGPPVTVLAAKDPGKTAQDMPRYRCPRHPGRRSKEIRINAISCKYGTERVEDEGILVDGRRRMA